MLTGFQCNTLKPLQCKPEATISYMMILLVIFTSLTVAIIAYIYFSYTFECLIHKIMLANIFFLATDDDHRVVLESIFDGVDCEHDYMNASYIDVRPLENAMQKFDW